MTVGSDRCCRCKVPSVPGPSVPGECDCSSFTGSWVVDLGVGGWMNVKCLGCVDIQGEYTVGPGSGCIKDYGVVPYCYHPDYPSLWAALVIRLQVVFYDTPIQTWRYQAFVQLEGWYPWGPGHSLSFAGFQSQEYLCSEHVPGSVSPALLGKIGEFHKVIPYSILGKVCSGSMPDEISIWGVG